MSEYLGPILIPEQTASGTFPIAFEYGAVDVREPQIAVHQFGTADTTIEQRFYLGPGQRIFRLTLGRLSEAERDTVAQFFTDRSGSLQPFTLNYREHDGTSASATVRFAQPVLTLEQAQAMVWAGQVDLVQVPAAPPSYTSSATLTRLPSVGLAATLLEQVHEIIPLVKIGTDVYVSDRKVTVDGVLYQPRVLDWDGIQQSIDGATDQVNISLGNADRVWKLLLDAVDLRAAAVTFSLFHVGSLTKVNLWAGEVAEFSGEARTTFSLRCWDRIADQRIAYPKDIISRQYPGMAVPDQPVNVGGKKGISPITVTSVTNDTAYGKPLKDIFVSNATQPLPVDCDIIAGRDESEFYAALGIVGRGPISGFYSGSDFPHALDGQPHHGPGALGLRRAYGGTPATGDPTAVDNSPDSGSDSFALDQVGQALPVNPCDGVAFIQIRRVDEKGIQVIQVEQEVMRAYLTGGLGCWTWTGAGSRAWTPSCTNPAWVVVNIYLRAIGLGTAAYGDQEAVFDVTAAIAAATFYDTTVAKIIGTGTEKQFEVNGLILGERKPLRDWIREILGSCLGYFSFRYGKLVLGVRSNSSAAEAFTAGNVLLGTIETEASSGQFNALTVAFSDPEYGYQANTLNLKDTADITARGQRDAQRNLVCAATKSQAARLTTVIFREEMGGISDAEKRAARAVTFQTTVLALGVEPGMVCSLTHEDAPGGAMEFRVRGWSLNRDYSITITGSTTTDSMYDLTVGDKPTDVSPDVLPSRPAYSLIPGDVQVIGAADFEVTLTEDGVSASMAIRYNPPATIGAFAGVAPVVEIPADSGNLLPQGNWEYNGDPDAVDETRYGTGTIVIPSPGDAVATWRVYLLSRSIVLTKTLDPLNTPQVDVEVGRFSGFADPTAASGVTASVIAGPDDGTYFAGASWTPGGGGTSAHTVDLEFYDASTGGTLLLALPAASGIIPGAAVSSWRSGPEPAQRDASASVWMRAGVTPLNPANVTATIQWSARVEITPGSAGGVAPPQPADTDMSIVWVENGADGQTGEQLSHFQLSVTNLDPSITVVHFYYFDTDPILRPRPDTLGEWLLAGNSAITAGVAMIDWWAPRDLAVDRIYLIAVTACSPTYHLDRTETMPYLPVLVNPVSAPLAILSPSVSVVVDDDGTLTGVQSAHFLLSGTLQSDANRGRIEIWRRWCSTGFTDPRSEWFQVFGPPNGPTGAWSWEQDKMAWTVPPDHEYTEWDFRAINWAEQYVSSATVQLHISPSGGFEVTALATKVDPSSMGIHSGLLAAGRPSLGGDIVNGGFEQGMIGWTVFGDSSKVSIVTSDCASGTSSLQITASTPEIRIRYLKVQVMAGQLWLLQTAMKRVAGTAGSFAVWVDWFTSAGALIGGERLPSNLNIEGPAAAGTWQTPENTAAASVAGAAPATAAFAEINVYITGTAGTVLLDSVVLRRQMDNKMVGAGAIDAVTQFGSSVRPVVPVTSLPALPNSNYPQGAVVTLTTDNKLYRSTGSAWTRAVHGQNDIEAATLTADRLVAGIISTAYLATTAIKIGGGASKCPRFEVVTSGDVQECLIGDNGAGFVGGYFRRIKIAATISATNGIEASASGVFITNVPISLTGTGYSIAINTTDGIKVTSSANSRILQLSSGGVAITGTGSSVPYSATLEHHQLYMYFVSGGEQWAGYYQAFGFYAMHGPSSNQAGGLVNSTEALLAATNGNFSKSIALVANSTGAVLKVNGDQVLGARQTDPGAPSFASVADAQTWCANLRNALKQTTGHGLF